MLKQVVIASSVILLAACGGSGPGTTKWCEAKKAQPKSEWTAEDAKTYATKCLMESTTIGSEAWCAKMQEKEKSELTVEEAADYAKNCVL